MEEVNIEEVNMLKAKYNDSLKSYKEGEKFLEKNPNNQAAQNRLLTIGEEMENILKSIKVFTEKEAQNGFKIEQVSTQVSAQVSAQPQEVKATPPVKKENVTVIATSSGNIELTPKIVKQYLVNGQGTVTDQEVAMFIGLCKANKLNPFNKEAYLIKYGTQAASMIVSKDVFFKRAIENPNFDGMESGIIVLNLDKKIEKRDGHIYLKGEEIIGAWCKVYRKDWTHPIYQEVNMCEYIGKKKGGEINSNWENRPAVMITKVAESTALRKAFTDNLQGMYLEEELDNNYSQEKEQPTDVLGV